MTKEQYDDFRLRYKGCGACFPMFSSLSPAEKCWFTAIYNDILEIESKYKALGVHCNQLQDDKGNLIDKVKELEIENEQIKNSDSLCKLIGEQKLKIKEFESQIDKMKCCGNCEWKAKGVCNGNDTCGLKEWKLVETRR